MSQSKHNWVDETHALIERTRRRQERRELVRLFIAACLMAAGLIVVLSTNAFRSDPLLVGAILSPFTMILVILLWPVISARMGR